MRAFGQDLVSVESVLSHCPASCWPSPTDQEEKQGQGCVEKTVTFSFNSSELAAKLHYVIEGVRWVGLQPRGRRFLMVSIHQGLREDFHSSHKVSLAGVELISLPCPSPDVGTEVPGPRLDYLSLREANWSQNEVALFYSKSIMILSRHLRISFCLLLMVRKYMLSCKTQECDVDF